MALAVTATPRSTSAHPHGDGSGEGCVDHAAVSQRYAALAGDDARAVDTAVACGCGNRPVTVDAFVRQYALGVRSAAEIDAPRTIEIEHHVVHLQHAKACQSDVPRRGP